MDSVTCTSSSIVTRRCAARVIAVTGSGAGLGKSCIVVNLGAALAEMGKNVLILDADLGPAGIHHLLGLRSRYTLTDILTGQKSLSEAIVTVTRGLQFVSAGYGREAFAELSQAQKLLLLEELDSFTEDVDFMLVDTGDGVSDNGLFFNLGAQEHIVVADQEPVSVINAYTLIKILANQYSKKSFKLVLNRISRPDLARHYFEQLLKAADRFLHGSVSLEYLGCIPQDASLPQSVGVRQITVKLFPSSPAGLAFAELARSLIVQEPAAAKDGNLKFLWQGLHQCAAIN